MLDQALAVVRRLRSAGHAALYAGGAVRDLVMGREPSDVDVATSATPSEVMALFDRTVPVGAQFGVVIVLPDGASQVEVATFRVEEGWSDERRPDRVRFTTAEEDARRRDFTINGLFLDPESGQIIDYVGGRADIERGVVRAIGDADARFAEDRLRMLRGVRFAARFQFRIEDATFRAIRRHASSIVIVSAERVRGELTRMLTEGNAAVALELLAQTGLLAILLPEVAALQGVPAPIGTERAQDAWAHTLVLLELLAEPSSNLGWAALLHDIGRPVAQSALPDASEDQQAAAGAELADRLLERLRFATADRQRVVAAVRDRPRFAEVPAMRESRLRRFLRGAGFDERLALYRLDAVAGHGQLATYSLCRDRLATLRPDELEPPRLLDGHDLRALGFEPGPAFGEMLLALEDAQLEGRVTTREEALALIARTFRPSRRAP